MREDRPGPMRPQPAALGCLAAAQLAWGGFYIYRTSFVVDGSRAFALWDDAMISMRYAKNLAAGAGLVWNPGEEAVQGFTNLGLTLGMAPLHLLPLDPLRSSLVVQLASLLALAALPWLAWRVARDCFGDPWIAYGSAVATAFCAPLAIWGLQGGDTTAVALWLLIALAWLAGSTRAGRGWPPGLFALLACGLLIRLDTVLFCAVFVAASALYGPGAVRRVLAGTAQHALVLVGMMAASQLYYGDPLPNSFYLKATGTPVQHMLLSGSIRLLLYWPGALPALLLAGFAVVAQRRNRLVQIQAGLLLAALAYQIRVGGDWAPQYGSRFFVPVLPVLLLLATAGGWRLARSVPGHGRTASRVVALGVIALTCLWATPRQARREWFDPRLPTMFRADNERNARLGLYLREYTRPDTRIAVHWAGLSLYLSERPGVDVLGKSDRHIARLEVPVFHPGHSKWDWPYVLEQQRPDVFLMLSRGLEDVPAFRDEFARVESRGLVFYLRRDSRDRLLDPEASVQPLAGPPS